MTMNASVVRFVTAGCVAVAAGPVLGQGVADSIPPTENSPILEFSAVDWSGAYGGLSFGLAAADGHASRSHFSGAVIELDVSNGLFPTAISGSENDQIGGVTLGYNIQSGNLVGGIEFDLSAPGPTTTLEFSRVDPGPLFPGVITETRYRTEISSLATLRLRGGYMDGRNFYFATAGIAAGRVENEFTLSLPNFPGLADGYASPGWREDGVRFGVVVGGGFERRLTERISFKGEALYYNLDDVTVEGRDSSNFPDQEIDYRFDNDGFVLRLGINFSF